MSSGLEVLVIAALPVIFAITLHEAAHAYAARYFGDMTAAAAGRISLNPVRHIDPIGTIALPAGILLLSGGTMLFGYAKPVPVNFARLRNPKRDMLWVAAAGPGANLFMLFVWALLLKIALVFPLGSYSYAFTEMANYGIGINIVLMVLNLLPLPPLDGGRIVVSLLPWHLANQFARIEPFGFPILVLLLVTGVLQDILGPIVTAIFAWVVSLFQLFP